jgi:phospholipase/carboxylesterase
VPVARTRRVTRAVRRGNSLGLARKATFAGRRLATALLASTVLLSCAVGTDDEGSGALSARPPGSERSDDAARLQVPPEPPGGEPPAPGLHPLGLGEARDGLLYVPAGYERGRAAPLVVLLHGAGGDPRGGIDPFLRLADDNGLLLVAPASRRETWDRVVGSYGPDVATVDRALARSFARLDVDRSRLAIAGFSDGASYALSLGLANDDLFTHVIAFSPGFAAPGSRRGRPRLFVTHGLHDDVLPISATSRRILRDLRGDGYDVRYREFDGGHTVPGELAQEAVRWLLEDGP